VVVTFDPHPAEVLRPPDRRFCRLSTAEEKAEVLKSLGVEPVVLPFTEEFAGLRPEEFLKEYLLRRLGARLLVLGYDWRFGKNAAGDFNLAKEFCQSFGCEVVRVGPYRVGGKTVSSSLVRDLLRRARLKEASLYLGRPYWIRRKPVKGKGLGRRLGFPTINFGRVEGLCLPDGVYAVSIDGLPAVANLGTAPTLKGERRTLEVHVLETPFEVSDRPRIVFKRFLREERVFKTAEDLVEQIAADAELARQVHRTD